MKLGKAETTLDKYEAYNLAQIETEEDPLTLEGYAQFCR
jgi:hypothetical protein